MSSEDKTDPEIWISDTLQKCSLRLRTSDRRRTKDQKDLDSDMTNCQWKQCYMIVNNKCRKGERNGS